MQRSPLTPSATSWSSKAGRWHCAGESTPGTESDTGTHPALRALGRAELTIYIVEDSEAVKERLIESVEDIPHARVVGSAEGVTEALEGMRVLQPRVLILDIQLRGGSGFRLLKLMRAAGMTRPETIIVVTNYPSDDYRTASRECGADHFFDKASEFHKVREVLLDMR
ncbi:MAG TPA: response regulator [Steroidobacteraceae bacterium]|nr:response regulator [Steroidobacteraceae bacterium]